MTVASRDGGHARRPVTRDDLYTGLPGAARSDVDAVLDAFAAERLAVLDEDRAQLSHDVLLRAWPRLRGWLEEDQASWILYSQVADAAAAWHDSRDDSSFLYRGAQLTALQQAVTRWSANPSRSPALTDTQRGFLQESRRQQIRSSQLRRGAVVVLAVVALVAASTAWFAFAQRSTAEASTREAILNQVTAEADELSSTDTSLAAELDALAYQMKPTSATYTKLISDERHTALDRPGCPVRRRQQCRVQSGRPHSRRRDRFWSPALGCQRPVGTAGAGRPAGRPVGVGQRGVQP